MEKNQPQPKDSKQQVLKHILSFSLSSQPQQELCSPRCPGWSGPALPGAPGLCADGPVGSTTKENTKEHQRKITTAGSSPCLGGVSWREGKCARKASRKKPRAPVVPQLWVEKKALGSKIGSFPLQGKENRHHHHHHQKKNYINNI